MEQAPRDKRRRLTEVEVVKRTRILDDFFVIEEAILRHAKFDGTMTGEVRRLNLMRGDASACLPYDPSRGLLFLIEQFRWPPYTVGVNPWLIEIPAGILSPGEDPADCIARELREETHLEAKRIEHLFTYFSTPGGSTERIFLYCAEVDGAGAADRIGGQQAEEEDIRVLAVPYEEAWRMVERGEICDGKTLLALFAFRDRSRAGA